MGGIWSQLENVTCKSPSKNKPRHTVGFFSKLNLLYVSQENVFKVSLAAGRYFYLLPCLHLGLNTELMN